MGDDGILEKALSSLGKGFDFTSDFRLKYCKGEHRLVLLNESQRRDLIVPGFRAVKDVSVDIKCDRGDRTRYQSDILNFNQMSELFNRKCSIPGKIPSGSFNAMFGFQSGCWASDAVNTKYLGLDGYFISLFNAHIDRYPLRLSDAVRSAVPSAWDPPAIARFIEKYGTHIIVGLSIGGHDVVLVRQDKSSPLEPSELKSHLEELGDQLFTGACTFNPKDHHKIKAPQAFNLFDPQLVAFGSSSTVSAKDGIIVITSKRGGSAAASSHCEWLPTVHDSPDAIHFQFIPIVSLLEGVPGKGFLSHAINLYLRYKPPIADLQYFLDFQVHKIWAPIHNDLPLGPTPNITNSPSLQLNLMGPKLYVNTTKVTAENKPVTGMRLYLEGIKSNRLAIHIQHLVTTPLLLRNNICEQIPPHRRGSEDTADDRYVEPLNRNKFSYVSTAPVKYDPTWAAGDSPATFIVTGAQLHVTKQDSKNVLHLRLIYSKVSNSYLVQTNWARHSSDISPKSGIFSAISTSISGAIALSKEKPEAPMIVDSGVFHGGPPVPLQEQKLVKFVDVSEMRKGPQDSPGHWVVIGARLNLEKGKVSLHVKFGLLHVVSQTTNES
ncbi:MACPF domain-containing protein At1g14780 [Momordica charantia]|uniref:MACPF domain-containing protein At1g14780 n=1 Tax=Momordica charantia TaxID=3673 RepID=A0A6J1CZH1_MOMCH|nr:MACPF domain-containing protein At1g14780 [Momordica charantia]